MPPKLNTYMYKHANATVGKSSQLVKKLMKINVSARGSELDFRYVIILAALHTRAYSNDHADKLEPRQVAYGAESPIRQFLDSIIYVTELWLSRKPQPMRESSCRQSPPQPSSTVHCLSGDD